MSDPRPGTSTKDLNALCPCVRRLFLDVYEAMKLREIPLSVIETARDLERQRYYKLIGSSKTLKSSHLPQPPNGKSLAVDAAPKSVLLLKNWGAPLKKGAPPHPDWLAYTAEARSAGLLCGADWAGQDQGWDYPHVYLTACRC